MSCALAASERTEALTKNKGVLQFFTAPEACRPAGLDVDWGSTFAILANKTLTTVLAGRVRAGTTRAISAMAVVIIGVTLVGAIAYEATRRAELRREAAKAAPA